MHPGGGYRTLVGWPAAIAGSTESSLRSAPPPRVSWRLAISLRNVSSVCETEMSVAQKKLCVLRGAELVCCESRWELPVDCLADLLLEFLCSGRWFIHIRLQIWLPGCQQALSQALSTWPTRRSDRHPPTQAVRRAAPPPRFRSGFVMHIHIALGSPIRIPLMAAAS